MAWPVSSVAAPNLDSGLVAVPLVAALVTPDASTPCWLLGAHFTNPTASDITVTATNGAGTTLIDLLVPAHTTPPALEWAFQPMTGLKWSASGLGLNGHIWGYY